MTNPRFLRLVTFSIVLGVVSQAWAEDRRLFGGRRGQEKKAATAASAPISAFTGLELMTAKFGSESVETIVEMRGREGQSQPLSWDLTVYDPESPLHVREFRLKNQEGTEQTAAEHYPDRAPTGFIDKAKLLIDSTASFRILQLEAIRAGVGFNHVDYLLRSREFSDEPIWQLTAVDVQGHTVGRVDLSGATGTVLRTIWYAWDPRRKSGAPFVTDSAVPEDLRPPRPRVEPRPAVTAADAAITAQPPRSPQSPQAPQSPQPPVRVPQVGGTGTLAPSTTSAPPPVVEVSPVKPATAPTIPQNPGAAPGGTPQPPRPPQPDLRPNPAPTEPGAVPPVEGEPVRVEPLPPEPQAEVEPASPR